MTTAKRWLIGLGVVVAVLAALHLFAFAVHEDEVVYVRGAGISDGGPGKAATRVGLHFRLPPPLQRVRRVPTGPRVFKRSVRVVTADGVPLDVEAAVVWRVADPAAFATAFRSDAVALTHLAGALPAVREAVAGQPFDALYTPGEGGSAWAAVKAEAAAVAQQRVDAFAAGVAIDNVLLAGVALPPEVEAAVRQRMAAERRAAAAAARAAAEAEAAAIRAEADADAERVLAFARRRAAAIRAAGDRAAATHFAELRDAEGLAVFLTRLDALKRIVDRLGVTVVLDPSAVGLDAPPGEGDAGDGS